ncbi:helix-turn-helix domain-containing protein [Gordonia sp. PP30]|uniref:PucR family transcriptional regulator n=1 Tax=Gordonia sp. PP30 TaxID=2935861 RepID=UPI001FFFAAEF|nr:helix-turn-helix domain-containing protein [Gordonia sp. PP30]UQE74753.1 helix-turn-helix domain-containing protein [Gordonia sp. PP30]
MLGGVGDAATAAALAGLRPDRGHAVVAAAVTGDDHARVRLALSAEFPHQRQVTTGGLLLAVLPVDPDGTDPDSAGADDDDRSVTVRLRARLGAALDTSPTAAVGVGPVVADLARLPESGRAARDVLRALRLPLGKPPSVTGLRIAEPQDVEDALQVVRASMLLRPHGGELSARLRLLADHDRAHRTELLPTVLTVATTASNVAEAARRLGVHPNSLRARLARIETVAGIDLGEPVSALRTVLGLLADPDLHRPARRD